MSRTYEGQVFDAVYDRNSGAVFEDLEFRRCSFEGSAIGLTEDPARRTTLRRIVVTRCEVRGCRIYPAIIEDSVVDGLKTGGPLPGLGRGVQARHDPRQDRRDHAQRPPGRVEAAAGD